MSTTNIFVDGKLVYSGQGKVTMEANAEPASEQPSPPPEEPADESPGAPHYGDWLDAVWSRSLGTDLPSYNNRDVSNSAGEQHSVRWPDDAREGWYLVLANGGPRGCGDVRVKDPAGNTIIKKSLTDAGSIRVDYMDGWENNSLAYKFIDGHDSTQLSWWFYKD